MALISDAADGWSAPISLPADEIWQARSGSVYVTTTASPVADDGLLLTEGEAVRISAGASVSYRRKGPVAAVIVREEV